MGDPQQDQRQDQTQTPQLYAPAETRARFEAMGINLNAMPAHAGVDVMIVDGALVNGANIREGRAELSANPIQRGDDLPTILQQENASYAARAQNESGGTLAMGDNNAPMIAAMSRSQSFSPAATTGFLNDDADQSTVCMISIPAEAATPERTVSFLSGIPQDQLRPIPGSESQWLQVILDHEVDHCRNISSDMSILQKEVAGDQHSIDSLHARFNESAADSTYTDMARTLQNARAVGTLLRTDFEHATAPFVQNGPQDAAPQPQAPSGVVEDVMDIQDAVEQRFARDSGLDIGEARTQVLETPGLLYNTLKQLDHEGTFRDNPVQQSMVSDFLRGAEELAPNYFQVPESAPDAAATPTAPQNRPAPAAAAPAAPGMS